MITVLYRNYNAIFYCSHKYLISFERFYTNTIVDYVFLIVILLKQFYLEVFSKGNKNI